MILRWITDFTCSPYSQVCRTTSEFFSHTSSVVFCFLLIIGMTKAKQIRDFLGRFMKAVEAVSGASDGKDKKD